jgi:hypothetical protein
MGHPPLFISQAHGKGIGKHNRSHGLLLLVLSTDLSRAV